LEIWTRENLRPQPMSVADRAKRCRVILHSRAMRDPSVRAGLALSARLRMTIRMA
jgi:hypothetical protein